MKELEKVVKVDFEDIVNLDREEFLDLLSELVVGAIFPCLSNISYEIMEFERPRFIVLHVSGEIEEDSDSEFDVCKKRIDDEQRCICDAGHIFCEEHLIHADDPDFEDEDAECLFRSHPYNPQAEREKVLNEKLASRYKEILMQCKDGIEDIRRNYEIAPKTCDGCSAYDLCKELRQKDDEQGVNQ